MSGLLEVLVHIRLIPAIWLESQKGGGACRGKRPWRMHCLTKIFLSLSVSLFGPSLRLCHKEISGLMPSSETPLTSCPPDKRMRMVRQRKGICRMRSPLAWRRGETGGKRIEDASPTGRTPAPDGPRGRFLSSPSVLMKVERCKASGRNL